MSENTDTEEIYGQRDVMLDVETLGNEGQFVVLSVAIVPFYYAFPNGNPGDESSTLEPLRVNICLASSIAEGFKADPDTIAWWTKQDPQTFQDCFKDAVSVKDAVTKIQAFFDHPEMANLKRVWASATLDYQAISNLAVAAGMPNPIPYKKRMCVRTVREVYAMHYSQEYERDYSPGMHDPIEDCRRQIKELEEMLSLLVCCM